MPKATDKLNCHAELDIWLLDISCLFVHESGPSDFVQARQDLLNDIAIRSADLLPRHRKAERQSVVQEWIDKLPATFDELASRVYQQMLDDGIADIAHNTDACFLRGAVIYYASLIEAGKRQWQNAEQLYALIANAKQLPFDDFAQGFEVSVNDMEAVVVHAARQCLETTRQIAEQLSADSIFDPRLVASSARNRATGLRWTSAQDLYASLGGTKSEFIEFAREFGFAQEPDTWNYQNNAIQWLNEIASQLAALQLPETKPETIEPKRRKRATKV